MAFTYSPTEKRGKVRLLIGDTDADTAANQVFTDAEIDAFLALEDEEVYRAAAAACRSIATSKAKSAVAWKALGTSLDLKQIPSHYRDLAKDYEERARTGSPSEEIRSMDYEIGRWGSDTSEYVGDQVT